MSRVVDPRVAFFPVELKDFYRDGHVAWGRLRKAADHHAVVDIESGMVFTAVTTSRRLVTNRDALETGCRARASAFHAAAVGADRDVRRCRTISKGRGR